MNRVLALGVIIPKTCVRRLSMAQVRCGKANLSIIKKKQIHFQEDNGVPIHLKGGIFDYVLYYTSIALVLFGLSASAHSTYKLMYKK